MRLPGLALCLTLSLATFPWGPPKLAAAEDGATAAPSLTPQRSGTTQRLQAISAVDERIAWASGTGGTFTVTADGGEHWRAGVVPGAQNLEFRDVQGISEQSAYLLSAGSGASSRIYFTEDGGKTWTEQFTNTEQLAFYDCFAFWDKSRALVMSDSVNGVFPVLRTRDGKTWEPLGERLPPAQKGEGAFASSGTCVATHGEAQAWIATGAGPAARVLATRDGGQSWTAHATPVVQGSPTSGVFTIAFRDAKHGFLGAGNLEDENGASDNTAGSSDGGASWALRARPPFAGPIYGSSYVPGRGPLLVITGPRGAAWSTDEGASWNGLRGVSGFWAVAFAGPRAGWLVGIEGRIVKLAF
jgi:photosystem II stability/assembly factor-like uncharacterized protein